MICITRAGLALLVLSPRAKKAGQTLRISEQQAIPLSKWKVSFSVNDPAEQTEVDNTDNFASVDQDPNSLYCLTWKTAPGRQHLQLRNQHPVLIGRKTTAGLQIADDLLSGIHCCVIRSDDKLWALDLGSTNGTHSGGEQRRVHVISLEKSISIGRQRMHLVRLVPNQLYQDLSAQVNELTNRLDEARETQIRTVDDNSNQQAALLASLRLSHQQLTDQRQQFDLELQKQRQLTASLSSQLTDLETQQRQITDEQLRIEENVSAQAKMESELQDAVTDLHGQVETLEKQRNELDARLASREDDLACRERELNQLAERVAQQQQETEQLKDELLTERDILKNLELDLQRESDSTSTTLSIADEEHCVASPDFHAILDEALGALPSLED